MMTSLVLEHWFFTCRHILGLAIEAQMESKYSAKCPGIRKLRKLNKTFSPLLVVPATIFPPGKYSPGMKTLSFGPFSFFIC